MSDTETVEETASSEELPKDLVTVPSGELHDRAEAVAAEAEQALDSGEWDRYKALAENERRLRSEIEKRGDAARKKVPTDASKIPVSAQEKIEQTRQALADAEAALEKFAGVKPRGNAPPPMGSTTEETDTAEKAKTSAFTDVEKIRADLAAMEARTDFLDTSDEQIATELEDTGIEAESLRLDLKRFTDEGRRQAAAKAERQLAEVTERHYSLMREDGVRKSERKREALLDQLAARKARFHREQALKDWTARKAELEESLQREVREGASDRYDMSLLREATQAVDSLTRAIETGQPLAASEIDRQRAALQATAPPVRGSFKNIDKEGKAS